MSGVAEEIGAVRFGKSLHARPMSALVKLAKTYEADIEVSLAEPQSGEPSEAVNGKSIFAMSSLVEHVEVGTRLRFRAAGPDAEQAAGAMAYWVENAVTGDSPRRLRDAAGYARRYADVAERIASGQYTSDEERAELRKYRDLLASAARVASHRIDMDSDCVDELVTKTGDFAAADFNDPDGWRPARGAG